MTTGAAPAVRTRPRVCAAATVAAMMAAGCTSPPAPSAARPSSRPPSSASTALPADNALAPTACRDAANWEAAGWDGARLQGVQVECFVLTVPRDHARPDAGSLDVGVMRVRAKTQHDRIGSLVLNPGGPGASGLDWMPAWAQDLPDELLARFDLVTFDPRGTGISAPLDCRDAPEEDQARPLADVLSDQDFADEQSEAVAHGRACAAAIAATGATFGTDAVARDLDLLRQGLREERLTYVGWSYGARLGAHYAHLFPDRFRALVLDGPPHPTATQAQIVDAQLRGFEATFRSYTDTCATRETCALVAGDPRRVFERVVRTARERPLPSGRPSGDPPATWDVVTRAVLGHLASPQLWPSLDQALSEADRGDAGSLYDMIDSLEGKTSTHPDADTADAQLAVLCTDSAPEAGDVQALRALAPRLIREHHTFGAYGAWWLFACATWSAPRTPLPAATSTATAGVLVVGGAADPSTPLAGAQALASVIGPAAALLVSSMPGHTSFPGKSTCVDERVVRFLMQPDRASSGGRCA